MYSLQDHKNGLKEWSNPVIDTHLHFWNEKLISFFFNWAEEYFSNYSVVSMMLPELIPKIPEEYRDRVIIAQFLTTKHLGEYNSSELVKQIDQAYSDGVKVIKLWLAPRFLDFNELKGPFDLLEKKLDPVFSRLEDYNYTVSAHIADPDLWYLFQYQEDKKYGKKIDHINKFLEIHKAYSGIKFFTTHFMCWPEHLKNLERILDEHQQLYINTGSTRWMIRELSKNNEETTKFIKKFQDRIIFGTDLHVTKEPIDPEYYATRFWSHRTFWETDLETNLPFPDEDSPFGVHYKGLNLPTEILDKIYYKNFQNFFKK